MKTTTLTLFSAALLIGLTTARGAESPAVGDWSGTLKVGASQLSLVVHVTEDKSGKLSAAMDSPDQGAFNMKADSASFDKGTFSFEIKRIQGKFSGKLDGKDTIAGEWTQAGATNPLSLAKGDPAQLAPPDVPKSLDGAWEGTLDAGGMKLRIVLQVKHLPDGTLVLGFDSPDQGAKGIGISSLSLKDGTLKFESKLIMAGYEGTLDEKTKEVKGKWLQGGQSFPLDLKYTDKPKEANRPQNPKPPFPYREEKVAYENKAGGVTLAGTLTLPKGDGPFPAVLLITGSGPQDRDESLMGHKPFLVIADYLTRRGIAVLRVDDRGVGGSTGNMAKATTDDFAGDVASGVGFLKAHKGVDPKRIGLIGHSEGGVIAPIVAVRSPDDVAFIVLMAGTGVNGERIAVSQSYLMAKAAGADDDSLKMQGELLEKLLDAVKVEKDPEAAAPKLKAIARDVVSRLPDKTKKQVGEAGDSVFNGLIDRVNNPWFRYFLIYDPAPTLAKVRCPVLAINGEKDLQVPPKENLPAIAEALKSGGNTHATVKELPGLNHLFQTCKTGALSEYSQIEETIAPIALETMGDWIAAQTKDDRSAGK